MPEETERFRAAIKKAKERTNALERFNKYVTYSCAWLESANSRLEAVLENPAQEHQHQNSKTTVGTQRRKKSSYG